MFNSIRLWFRWEAKYLHRDIIQGIKNLFKWFPVIWKDRDWDDHYIWELLKFKLKNQSKYIGYHDRHTTAKRDAEIMMTCVRLIDKIQTEFYQSEYSDYQETEFYFEDCNDMSNHKMLKIKELNNNFDEYFKKYPLIHKKVLKMEKPIFKTSNDSGIAMNVSYVNHERARKLLFKILENNIERWWD
jgi:hypothetical protein